MKLRDYQERALETVANAAARRIVLVAPTGSGKTVIAAELIRRLKQTRVRVLWLAHRVELLRQARASIAAAGFNASDVGISSGVEKRNVAKPIVVASVMTAEGVLAFSESSPPWLIVVDEAHRVEAATYRRILARFQSARVLGLTATPWRLDGQGLKNSFDQLIIAAQPHELEIAGHLATPRTFGIEASRARELVRGVRSQRGDYDPVTIGKTMMRGVLMGETVSECARLAPNQRTIVFAATREHGRALTATFVQSGRSARYLDGDTPPKERDEIVAELRSNIGQVVVNVDVLSEGVDIPAVECIVLARPTRSLTRYLQQVGRGARPRAGANTFIVLDHAGNWTRHGVPDDVREWTLEGRAKGASSAPTSRHCQACGAIVSLSLELCPGCGAALEKVSANPKLTIDVELEEIRRREAWAMGVRERIRQLAIARRFEESWVRAAEEKLGVAL